MQLLVLSALRDLRINTLVQQACDQLGMLLVTTSFDCNPLTVQTTLGKVIAERADLVLLDFSEDIKALREHGDLPQLLEHNGIHAIKVYNKENTAMSRASRQLWTVNYAYCTDELIVDSFVQIFSPGNDYITRGVPVSWRSPMTIMAEALVQAQHYEDALNEFQRRKDLAYRRHIE